MKITNENAADCTIRIADDMNYGWGEFKKGVADNSKHVQGRGRKKEEEVPSTSQENTDSCEIQGWSPL